LQGQQVRLKDISRPREAEAAPKPQPANLKEIVKTQLPLQTTV
jgi:hypothetical protein